MSFSIINVAVFSLLIVIREISFDKTAYRNQVNIKKFLKDNWIFFLVVIALYLKLNEIKFLSPDWPLTQGRLFILFSLISAWCTSAVIANTVIYIKNISYKD
ncbi:hypothetical protein ACXX82_09810 [Glaciimonas sp. GNP009]|uniref:hypothetical protein n=1 Tax=Glaciimonas sp. Cout2 TaxID=3048621 RepID=UPI002B23D344|nr:hypothetical protein [Glaciimonas sp. Cout2]MEB0011471.1 hypothetical protein [Glaciimonas sp. Cout2]